MRSQLDDVGLAELADELLLAAPGGRRRLLVVVDQFEELLIQAVPAERARFAALLCPALTGPVQVVGTLRSEFLDAITCGVPGSFLDRRLTARTSNLSVLAAIGLSGMSGAGLGDPECADRVVDAVPDPSTRGDLELPLFHAPITYGDYPEAALEAVLTAVGPAGVASDGYPRPIDGLGDLPQQLVPSDPSAAICGSDRPRVRSCDFVAPFGHAE